MIARIVILAAGIATVAACGAQNSGSASGGGLYGIVHISPASPVCQSGTSCSRPARHFKLLFGTRGRTVTATTNANGRYRVQLSGGSYTVRAATANTSPKHGLQPRTVRVPSSGFVRRNFIYDSGIR